MNEDTGQNLIDSSGNDNNGSGTNLAWGRLGLDLSGSNEHVNISNFIGQSDDWTILTRFIQDTRNLDSQTSNSVLVSMANGIGTGRSILYIDDTVSTTYKLSSFIDGSSNTADTMINTGLTYSIAFSQEGRYFNYYLNGSTDGSISTTADSADGNIILFDNKNAAGDGCFDGTFDYLFWYRRSMAHDTIETIHNNTNSPSTFTVFGAEEELAIGVAPDITDWSSLDTGNGGREGGTSREPYANTEFEDTARVYISRDAQISFTFDEPENDIQYVRYKALTNAGYIRTLVEMLKNTSTFAKEAPPDIIYKNINIWVGTSLYATEKNIENPVVGFKVEKMWIENNNIEESSIKLNRYHGDTWTTLSTAKTDEDASYVYFESQTPGFSPFAITGQKKLIAPTFTMLPEESTKVEAPLEPTPWWKYLLAGTIILLIIAGVCLYLRKQQS